MPKTVHILNGDSTLFGLKESKLEGDYIIWREMLVEGPLVKNIGSDDFWKQRYDFFENEFQVQRMDYYDKTIKELVKIEDLLANQEIVLWFEFDLFCQINLLGLCSYLLKYYRKDLTYFLICTGHKKGEERLQHLSDYSPKEYQELYLAKTKITRHDLLYAESCWNIFCEGNLQQMRLFNFNKNKKFKYLQPAINQHFKRIESIEGLTQIDHKILYFLNNGYNSKKDLLKEILHWQAKETVYGFGGLQYLKAVNKLKEYYIIKDSAYFLNQKGKDTLALYENHS